MTTLDLRIPTKDIRSNLDNIKDYPPKKQAESTNKEPNGQSQIRKSALTNDHPTISEDPENLAHSSNSSFSKMKNVLIDDLKISELVTKCLTHTEEEVQFYSFTKDKTLCAECLVSGAFQGHEIANIKKATARIRHKVEDYFQELNNRMDSFVQIDKRFDEAKKEVTNVFKIFSKSVETNFAEIRRKIDEKEKEIKSSLEQNFKEKLSELEATEETIKIRKEEISKTGETLQKCVSQLKNDEELCHYFSRKVNTIKALINDDDLNKIQELKQLIELRCSPDQINLSKFKDGIQNIIVEVSTLKGLEEPIVPLDSLNSAKASLLESPKGENKSHATPDLLNFSNIQRSKDTSKILQTSISSSFSGSPGKFIKTFDSSSLLDSKDAPRISSNALIDKHLRKLLAIKTGSITRQPPKEIIIQDSNLHPTSIYSPKSTPKVNMIDELFNSVGKISSTKSHLSPSKTRTSPKKANDLLKGLGAISEFNLTKKAPTTTTASRRSLADNLFERTSPSNNSLTDSLVSPTKRSSAQLSIANARSKRQFLSNVQNFKKDIRGSLGQSSLRLSVKDSVVNMSGSKLVAKNYSPKDIDLLGLLRKQKDRFDLVTIK